MDIEFAVTTTIIITLLVALSLALTKLLELRREFEMAETIIAALIETPINTAQAAQRLGVSAKTVRKLVREGTLEGSKVGRRIRISPSSLIKLRGQINELRRARGHISGTSKISSE